MNRKHISTFPTALYIILGIIAIAGFSVKSSGQNEKFSFVFLSDIHLTPDRDAVRGFMQAIDTINELKPDFVITGGDQIMDALGQKYSRADSLYDLYLAVMQNFKMPVYHTMGNHDIYGIYKKSRANPNHPEYGEKMFEKRLGKSYYAFEHKGWKFMVLNSVEDTRRNSYIGMIDRKQLKWIEEEIKRTDSSTPVVLVTHIPFITIYTQKYKGSTRPNDSSQVVVNAKKVLDMFRGHNLKLVLQGHLHMVEDLYMDGIHFITGGAVSAEKWLGPMNGCKEGFMLITISNGEFSQKYVTYGWQVKSP